ncbi:MAG: cation:proton antiporter [Planctomycetes bacterium]|nr:cation:proton antiporter [Planctomycetota bacterium]
MLEYLPLCDSLGVFALIDPANAAHTDPIGNVVLMLAVILIAAKLGGHAAARCGQPAVLGELLAGVVIGNLYLAGVSWFEPLKSDATIDMLARLGVLILLFEVGLESTVAQMLRVGASSFFVATLGVLTPFALGWGVGAWLLPEESGYVHAFIGATLTATSVGITARVLRDLGRLQSNEARIILGAAVIDDVMGLVILAVVSGIITAAASGAEASLADSGWILAKAVVFLVGALTLGVWLSPHLFRAYAKLSGPGLLLSAGLAFCFALSWLAGWIGLAPIVGAFAAGLILEDHHSMPFAESGHRSLADWIHPLSSMLVPIFFVLMGARTELRAFQDPALLILAGVLCVAAVAGKQACSLGIVGGGIDRLSVGIGMVPRGEVGLIFANMGAALQLDGKPVVSGAVFSAVVIMVIVTTFITPPALKWSLARGAARRTS